jgi:DNA-binding GntR family transcriptional regulator
MTKRSKTTRKCSEADRVVDLVRQSIFAGKLSPGEPIHETRLARQYGVSQTTVREALARLDHAGFVRRIPKKGTFVTQLSVDELREHLRLRLLLETLAAADAARRVTQESLAELRRRLQAIAGAVAVNDYFASALADLEFHRWIWLCSGDRTLYRMLDQITAPLFAFISIRRSHGNEDLKRVVLSHQPIAEALERGDQEAAREAIRAHIENSYLQFLRFDLGTLFEQLPGALRHAADASEAGEETLPRS